jgi:hypothetical protein
MNVPSIKVGLVIGLFALGGCAQIPLIAASAAIQAGVTYYQTTHGAPKYDPAVNAFFAEIKVAGDEAQLACPHLQPLTIDRMFAHPARVVIAASEHRQNAADVARAAGTIIHTAEDFAKHADGMSKFYCVQEAKTLSDEADTFLKAYAETN